MNRVYLVKEVEDRKKIVSILLILFLKHKWIKIIIMTDF